jgi:hypothetical protein
MEKGVIQINDDNKITAKFGAKRTKKLVKFSLVLIGVIGLMAIFIKVNTHSPLSKENLPFLDWEYSESGTKEPLRTIKYINNQFIVVGEGGIILKSTEGKTWEKANSPINESLSDVAYGNGKYVAVGSVILTSVDGNNWVNIDDFQKEKGNFNSITYGDGKFVATRSGSRSILISTDAVNWIEVEIPPISIANVVFAENKFIAIGNCAKGITSSNGIDWTEFIADQTTANKRFCDYFVSIDYNNGRYVAADLGYDDTQFGKVFVSTDGIKWKKSVEFDAHPSGAAINDKGEMIVIGSNMLLESTNGSNWKWYKLDKYSNSKEHDSLESVVYGNGIFVTVGLNGVIMTK